MEIEDRIRKDIGKFSGSVSAIGGVDTSDDENRIVELAKMYASDAVAWLDKGDLYTSFSSISYAHGLLDALLRLKHLIE